MQSAKPSKRCRHHNCFFVILLKLAPQTARQDAASDDSDNADDSAGSSSS